MGGGRTLKSKFIIGRNFLEFSSFNKIFRFFENDEYRRKGNQKILQKTVGR